MSETFSYLSVVTWVLTHKALGSDAMFYTVYSLYQGQQVHGWLLNMAHGYIFVLLFLGAPVFRDSIFDYSWRDMSSVVSRVRQKWL